MSLEQFSQQPESSAERKDLDPRAYVTKQGESLAGEVVRMMKEKYGETAKTIHETAEKFRESA